MTGPLCHDDAAYVLGALSPSERRSYELHLNDCATCQRSVRDLAGLPGLLSRVAPGDFDSEGQRPPATLLPGLVEAVNRRRARRRWLSGALAVGAALTALAVALGVQGPTEISPSAGGMALSPVTESAISARAQLREEPWGTQIALTCSYDRSSPYARSGQMYALVVVDDAGRSRQIATWKVVSDAASTVTGSVGWDRTDIAEVEIRTLDGSPVLRLAA
jgi:hypothetical protein